MFKPKIIKTDIILPIEFFFSFIKIRSLTTHSPNFPVHKLKVTP